MSVGYFLKVASSRIQAFQENVEVNWKFAEPVPTFSLKRGYAFLVFISTVEDKLTHLALGTGGMNAGTQLRRLNLENILLLPNPVLFKDILRACENKMVQHLRLKLEGGGLLQKETYEELKRVLVHLDSQFEEFLTMFNVGDKSSVKQFSKAEQEILASQKDAINVAMEIAELDRKELLEWSPTRQTQEHSFLEGLSKEYLTEDSMIFTDGNIFPGFETIRPLIRNRATFFGNNAALDVIVAHRTKLELLAGIDLIYYNRDFRSFVMVQYKAMEKVGGVDMFRLPNEKLTDEIKRMRRTLHKIGLAEPESRNCFKFSYNPFFIKLCPRVVLDPDSIEMIKGMYIPLDYWDFLESDKDMVGPKGGRHVSYGNVGRYLNNSTFTTFVREAWVGTAPNQSEILAPLINGLIENNKSVVLAVKF